MKIKEVDGLDLVKKFSEEMESMLRRKVEAVEVSITGMLLPNYFLTQSERRKEWMKREKALVQCIVVFEKRTKGCC